MAIKIKSAEKKKPEKKRKDPKDHSVKKLLHSVLPGFRPTRPKRQVHASELSKEDHAWCPREYALLDLTGKSTGSDFIGTSLRTTFDYGIDVQRRINEDYLITRMVGDWVCKSCNKEFGVCKKPKTQRCGAINCQWEYHEVRPVSSWNGVSCGLDALIDFKDSKYMITEIKTIKAEDFKELRVPIREHRARTSLYMRLVSEWKAPFAEQINTTEARLLYVCKGFGYKDQQVIDWGVKDAMFSPFKEFRILRDDTFLENEMNRAKVLHYFRKKGKGMPCGVCKSATDKRASKCPVKSECWSGAYPPKLTWVEDGKKYHKDKAILKSKI